MKPQSAKAKGRKLQQQIAQNILDYIHTIQKIQGHERFLDGDDVQSVSMGVNGEDIKMSSAAKHYFPFSIECKNCERLNIWNAIDQCKQNNPDTRAMTSLVVFKKNKNVPYVCLEWSFFIDILEKMNILKHREVLHTDTITDTYTDNVENKYEEKFHHGIAKENKRVIEIADNLKKIQDIINNINNINNTS